MLDTRRAVTYLWRMDIIEERAAHLHRLERRPNGIYAHIRALRRLEAFAAPTSILELGVEDLRSFIARPSERRDTPRGSEGRRSESNHLRSFFRWAIVEGLRVDDPTVRLERPRVPRRLPRPMPEDQVGFVLTNAPDRIRPWFWLAAYAVLRACEIGPLRGEDVHDGWIYVREQKGGDEGVVPLSPVLVPIVESLPPRGYLFPKLTSSNKKPVEGPTSAAQISKLSNQWLQSQGIESSLHSLRHWFGTWIHRGCHDFRLTQEAMRHRSASSTVLYTAVDRDEIVKAVAALPNLAMPEMSAPTSARWSSRELALGLRSCAEEVLAIAASYEARDPLDTSPLERQYLERAWDAVSDAVELFEPA